MEIKKITKTDKVGKRLFVELGKNSKKGNTFLPELEKGNEVLVMPRRKLNEEQMRKLVGQYVIYYDIDNDSAMIFEGVIKLNKMEYWEEGMPKGKYVLLDPTLGEDEIDQAIDAFDDLNDVFDLQVFPEKAKQTLKIKCWKCGRQYYEAYKFCPHCGKKNNRYKDKEVIKWQKHT